MDSSSVRKRARRGRSTTVPIAGSASGALALDAAFVLDRGDRSSRLGNSKDNASGLEGNMNREEKIVVVLMGCSHALTHGCQLIFPGVLLLLQREFSLGYFELA